MSFADLPALNATLNGTSFSLLLAGYLAIRRGDRRLHRGLMLTALGTSTVFLASYLVYHAHVGSVHYPGRGPLRAVYFAILVTHSALATCLAVLIPLTVARAFRGRFDRHRSIARLTLPIWAYVSLTGVVVYLMLYVWPSGAIS